MTLPGRTGVQSPLNFVLPIKSHLSLAELDVIIHLKLREILEATDSIGTLHFGRFVNLHDHNQLGFFTAFDGDFKQYILDFTKYIGPIFDALYGHVVDGPPVPVEKNTQAFLDYHFAHNLEGIGFYSAYPNLSVQDIRTRAGIVKGAVNEGIQSPLTLVLPMKSPSHLMSLSQFLTQSLPKLYQAADAMATVHFARFIPLGTTALAYVSEYDGDFGKHMQDLTMHLGTIFNEAFQYVNDPPPTPVQKNIQAFSDWVSHHNLKPWAFYTGYPTLSVQDIRTKAAKASA